MLNALLDAVPPWLLLGWLVVVNGATATAYGYDKAASRRGGRRIRERTLLLLNVAGGVLGAWLVFFGMRHKTLHRRFWVVQSLATVLWAAVVLGVLLA